MIIKNIIVHRIISQQHIGLVETVARDKVIALPDSKADNLLASVLDSYKKDGFLAYAGFSGGEWFPSQLRKLYDGSIVFYDFSVEGLEKLRQYMERVPASTGGYLTYIHYLHEQSDFFMVILLKDREGIGITSELDLERVLSLELDKLHFAARIDIDRWLSENVDERRNHVSFLKGRGRNEVVVNYFKSFLGIDEDLYLDPARHTSDLVKVVKNFVAINFSKIQEKDQTINSVYEYANTRKMYDQSIAVQDIARLIYPTDPAKFLSYIDEQKIEIPNEFKPVERILDRLVKFRIRTNDYYLSFDRTAIENNVIWLNNDGHLVLREVPDSIKNQLLGSG